MRTNQLRLWFASVAHVLVTFLRHFGLKTTELERAQAGTTRLKVAAIVPVSVRRVVLSLSATAPIQRVVERIAERFRTALLPPDAPNAL
jgi:hypothetical protein